MTAAYMADDPNGSVSAWALNSASVSLLKSTLNTAASNFTSLDSRFIGALPWCRANVPHSVNLHALTIRHWRIAIDHNNLGDATNCSFQLFNP
jgi:hypothetical protein